MSYNDISRRKYEEMCPYCEKEIVMIDNAPWFNAEIRRAKLDKKKKERIWRRLRTDEARKSYRDVRNKENRLIVRRKREYCKEKLYRPGLI